MGLIYPVHEETEEDSPAGYDDLAADLSDRWLVEVQQVDDGDELEIVNIGPLSPRAAWELANQLEELRPQWYYSIMPLYDEPETAQELVEAIEADSGDV